MVSMSSSSMLLAEILSWVAAAESSRSHNELKSGKKGVIISSKTFIGILAFSSCFFAYRGSFCFLIRKACMM